MEQDSLSVSTDTQKAKEVKASSPETISTKNDINVFETKNVTIPDFKTLFEQTLGASTLTNHPHYYNLFLFPGEENGDKINQLLQEITEKQDQKQPLQKTQIQQMVLNAFHAYPVHANIICSISKQLSMILSHNETTEIENGILPLSFDDPEFILPEILNFCYSRKISINENNAIGVLIMSQRLMIEDLAEFSLNFLNESIKLSNCLDFATKFARYPEGSEIFMNFSPKRFVPRFETSDEEVSKDFSKLLLEELERFCHKNLPLICSSESERKKLITNFESSQLLGLIQKNRLFAQKQHTTLISNLLFSYLQNQNCISEGATVDSLPGPDSWKLTIDDQIATLQKFGIFQTLDSFVQQSFAIASMCCK